MTVSVHTMAIETFVPTLRTLTQLFDKAAEHATARKFDPSVFVASRLAPDMYTLGQQVYMACHYAKDAVTRLTGGEPEQATGTGDDKTLDDLKARIAATIDALEKVSPKAFDGAEKREIKMPLFANFVLEMTGPEFLQRWSLQHFHFHTVTAYDLLRHNGVEIGKRDFVNVGSFIHQR
jgi:uncharacterized protein